MSMHLVSKVYISTANKVIIVIDLFAPPMATAEHDISCLETSSTLTGVFRGLFITIATPFSDPFYQGTAETYRRIKHQ